MELLSLQSRPRSPQQTIVLQGQSSLGVRVALRISQLRRSPLRARVLGFLSGVGDIISLDAGRQTYYNSRKSATTTLCIPESCWLLVSQYALEVLRYKSH